MASDDEVLIRLRLQGGKATAAEIAQVNKELDKTGKTAANATNVAGGLGPKLTSVGGALTKTLTPAAVGAGLAFRTAFNEFDTGADSIRAQTGKTGAALEAMVGSMKSVGSQVNVPLSQVGEMMGQVASRTGMTGPPLEKLTGQLLKLGSMGQQVSAESATRFFGDWSIATDKQSDALDRMFKVSQVSGVGMSQLMDLVVQFGAPLRALGFDTDSAQLMIAKFNKEGVNTEAVLAGMKMGLGKMAKAGEDPVQTFDRLLGEMKNAKTDTEAFGIAIKAFGQRAGPDLAMAVREGRFELNGLNNAADANKDTIESAYKATLDWGDKLGMLKNKIYGVIGPVGEMGMALAGVAAGVGPVMQGLGSILGKMGERKAAKMTIDVATEGVGETAGDGIMSAIRSKLGKKGAVKLASNVVEEASATAAGETAGGWLAASAKLGKAGGAATPAIASAGAAAVPAGASAATGSAGFWALAASIWAVAWPVLAVVAAVAVLVGAFLFLTKVLGVDTKTAIMILAAVLFPMLALAFAPIIAAVWLFKTHWDTIWNAVQAVVRFVVGAVVAYWQFGVAAITTVVRVVVDVFRAVWGAVVAVVRGAADMAGRAWDNFTAGLRVMANVVKAIFGGVVDTVKGAINIIIAAINLFIRGVNGITGLVGNIPGVPSVPKVPEIPKLHSGGGVAGAGLANIQPSEEIVWLPQGAQVEPLTDSDDRPPPRPPEIIQLVVDRKVLAEVTRDGASDKVARK